MNIIKYNELLVDLDRKECSINNEKIDLTKTEYSLLVFFLENKNKIYTRKEIMQNVWGYTVSLRAIDTSISRLRKKLKSIGSHIITKLGFGYGFFD